MRILLFLEMNSLLIPVSCLLLYQLPLNVTNILTKQSKVKKFSYKIKIADFYFNDTAKIMLLRIINETEIKNPKIKKISEEKYRVYLGPFNNINSLQKTYNDINILEFENIEIIKND